MSEVPSENVPPEPPVRSGQPPLMGQAPPPMPEAPALSSPSAPENAPSPPSEEDVAVLAELDKLQTQKPGWQTAFWVLVASLAIFVGVGAKQWNWKFTLWILPVLAFHEVGHWVAMRIFGYRNLRMFFIPLFGAAVTGQHWNVPGWKKVLVSLAGPLPGIAVGALFGIAGLILHHTWMKSAALVLLLLNGLNLIPILPLDGGHVLQATLFCRNRWLDLIFRVLALASLAGLALLGMGRFLFVLAGLMLFSLPLVFAMGKVAEELRRQLLPQSGPGDDRIPSPTALTILAAVRKALPTKVKIKPKQLAQHTLNVFETMNARPPGWLATFCLLTLHAGALFAAAQVSMFLVMDRFGGGLQGFLSAAIRQPDHEFRCGDFERWSGGAATNNHEPCNRIIATFTERSAALAQFSRLTNRLPDDAALLRFGDMLVVALPVADDAARERWFDNILKVTTNTFVAASNGAVPINISFVAPTLAAATNLVAELNGCLQLMGGMHLVPPWSPQARRPEFDAARKARAQWRKIETEVNAAWGEAEVREYAARIATATQRGATAEARRLAEEQTATAQALQAEKHRRLRAPDSGVDPELIDLHEKLNSRSLTNRAERIALFRQVEIRLGAVAYEGNHPAPGADDFGLSSGAVLQNGLLINLNWFTFRNVSAGLPALAEWLCARHVTQFKYGISGHSAFDDFESALEE